MQLNLSASPKSTKKNNKRNNMKKLQHINVRGHSRLIHDRFDQREQSGNLGSNDIKVVSGVCAGSRVIEWHQSGQWSVRRLACVEIETDGDCVTIVKIRNKLSTVFCKLWFITIKIFEMTKGKGDNTMNMASVKAAVRVGPLNKR